MKKLEFTTGKGRFVIMDVKDVDYDVLGINGHELEKIGYLDELTEEQAIDIVDKSWDSGIKITTKYPNYETNDWSYYGSFGYALDSLHSLIKSKWWYLEKNPVQESIKHLPEKEQHYRQLDADWQQAESLTLHNPVIFKIKYK